MKQMPGTRKWIAFPLLLLLFCNMPLKAQMLPQHTVARKWMNTLLGSFKLGLSRPTVNARNMFHVSATMYDAWAVYDGKAVPYFLGNTIGGFEFPYPKPFQLPEGMNADSAKDVTISYAVHTLLTKRFRFYGSKTRMMDGIDSLFLALGHDPFFDAMDYTSGSPAALGNYIGTKVFEFGLQDGSKEEDRFENESYEPRNPTIRPDLPGTNIRFPNLWQPILIRHYMDKRKGDPSLKDWQLLAINNQDVFLSAEWGQLPPFALNPTDRKTYRRNGMEFTTYLDPGAPPMLREDRADWTKDPYKWGFVLVGLWSGQLDPDDGKMIDISPGAIGNLPDYPRSFQDYAQCYNLMNGGIRATSLKLNPKTKKPYSPNRVLRGDYARAIAEYWVDGVNTVTPMGHWIELFHKTMEHPEFRRKWKGKGKELAPLDWDIRCYFTISGAMHDAAIAAWSIKAYYDYVRPISAIRFMGGKGQCTHPEKASWHPQGLPLIPGCIELVEKNDPLAGEDHAHLGKIKMWSWKGPDAVADPKTDRAGVGWILAENWWPYQRYSFVTPSFAGYVSGHSTFSVAAAEMLTYITGDPFFPGGLAEVTIPAQTFLEFEKGPSKEITLQWATYRAAANEVCLSRLWGGIHPPCDDMVGRLMGVQIAEKAFRQATYYLSGKTR